MERKRNTKNYLALPYNPKLKDRAKSLRKAGNLSEIIFWNEVKNGKFIGFDFDRQKIVGNYIVDFYCSNNNVVIEIDGSSHNSKQDYDAKRDAYLLGLGLKVIHIQDKEVSQSLQHHGGRGIEGRKELQRAVAKTGEFPRKLVVAVSRTPRAV